MRKVTTTLVVAGMLSALLCGSASADNAESITINQSGATLNIPVGSSNSSREISISVGADTATITLTDAEYSSDSATVIDASNYSGDLTIIINGNCSLTSTGTNSSAIIADGNLIIIGDDDSTLALSAVQNTINGYSDVTLQGGTITEITATTSKGIVSSGALTLDGVTIDKITAGAASGAFGDTAIYGGTGLEITDCIIGDIWSYGGGLLNTSGGIAIENSTINSITSKSSSSAIFSSDGDVSMDNVTIGTIDAHYLGIASNSADVSLTKTNIEKITFGDNYNATGISASGTISLESCQVGWIVGESAQGSMPDSMVAEGISIIDSSIDVIAVDGDAFHVGADGLLLQDSTLGFVYGYISVDGETTIANTALSLYGEIVSMGEITCDMQVTGLALSDMVDENGDSDKDIDPEIEQAMDEIAALLEEGAQVPTLDDFPLLSVYAVEYGEHVTMYTYSTKTVIEDNDFDVCTVLQFAFEDEDDGPRSTSRADNEVAVDSNKGGSVSVDKDDASQYEKVTITTTPDAGYTVGAVTVTDASGNALTVTDNGDGTYSFRMPDGAVEIEVDFVASDDTAVATGSPFLDLSPEDDAFEAILALYENGIIYGMTDTTFGGDLPINRGMITTMLHRIAGLPDAQNAGFTDVADGQWYTAGINWASEMGIVAGYTDGTFLSTQEITNQEMCVILMNFAISCGVEVDENLSADDVADWAATAVAWAMELGMFEGEATDVVTRELACEMIYAVLEYLADAL